MRGRLLGVKWTRVSLKEALPPLPRRSSAVARSYYTELGFEPVMKLVRGHMGPSLLFPADTCGDLLVTLQSLSRQGEKRSLQLSGKVNSMTFTFDNVLPGKYKSKNWNATSCGPPTLLVFVNFLKPRSQIVSQPCTFPCLSRLCLMTLTALFSVGQAWRSPGPELTATLSAQPTGCFC